MKLSKLIQEHINKLDNTSIYALRSLKDKHRISLDHINEMLSNWLVESMESSLSFFDFYVNKGLFLNTYKSSVPLMEKGLLSHRKQAVLKSTPNEQTVADSFQLNMNVDADHIFEGQRLGRCTIIRKIAKGSSCKVFLANHESLGIQVAVKIFHNFNVNFNMDDFRREARTVAKFNHSSFVRILDFDDGILPHLVLEYVDGYTLAGLIKQNIKLDEDNVIRYLKFCVKAFDYLHLKNISHRDIKPENIMLNKDGEIKISDFGISRLLNNGVTLNQPFGACGTPLYIAPEQALYPDVVDIRSDIYSLGATFYHALTGQTPFQAENARSMILQHINKPVVPPNEVEASISQGLSDLIVKMMAKDVNKRFGSMAELLEAIRALEKGKSTKPEVKRKRPSTLFRFQR
ncbi:MAG: serine/threonine protein kinase [Lentisphaeraceae bacterium]|nr:serine/threonine protein kinase [Lentisphaeraceae bacterium]